MTGGAQGGVGCHGRDKQPVSGGEWTEYQKLRAERKALKENIVTVVASFSAQKQRRVGNPDIEAKVTGELIAVH